MKELLADMLRWWASAFLTLLVCYGVSILILLWLAKDCDASLWEMVGFGAFG